MNPEPVSLMSIRGNIGGNYSDKYRSRNPIARYLVNRFFAAFDELVAIAAPTAIFEVGCGEGELLKRLHDKGYPVAGCDVDDRITHIARKRLPEVSISCAGITDLAPEDISADLVICCEVLEHLSDAKSGLDALKRIVNRYALLSVPREPLWRLLNMARGRYLRCLGNTPGHINHWSRSSFLAELAARWEIVAVRSPLPWTVALCRQQGGNVANPLRPRQQLL